MNSLTVIKNSFSINNDAENPINNDADHPINNDAENPIQSDNKEYVKLGCEHLIKNTNGKFSLAIFSILEQLYGARIFLHLCNTQGAALVRIQVLPPTQRLCLRTLIPVYDIPMEPKHRLKVMGSGIKSMIPLMMTQGAGGPMHHTGSIMKNNILRRVAAGQMLATPEGMYANAEVLLVKGEFASAVKLLTKAIIYHHLPSFALLSSLLCRGRVGVPMNHRGAFILAEKGARMGCYHCKGQLAICYTEGTGCLPNHWLSLALAVESAAKGSRYGQFAFGHLHYYGKASEINDDQAYAYVKQAANQGLDEAMYILGSLHAQQNENLESMKYYQLAADKGHPNALMELSRFYSVGLCVPQDFDEYMRLNSLAIEAGYNGTEV